MPPLTNHDTLVPQGMMNCLVLPAVHLRLRGAPPLPALANGDRDGGALVAAGIAS